MKYRIFDKNLNDYYNELVVTQKGEIKHYIHGKIDKEYSEKCIIEQSTGIKDINGNEIYIGDKIKCNYIYTKAKIGIIRDFFKWWDYTNRKYYTVLITEDNQDIDESLLESIKIIGNIHEKK